jgi:hypothetical protein
MLRTKETSSVYLPMPRRVFLTPQAEAKTMALEILFLRKLESGKSDFSVFTSTVWSKAFPRCHY